MPFVTRLGDSNIYICKRMINEPWVACNRFPELPIAGTFPGEAASLPVSPSSRKKHACPAARGDVLLAPGPFFFQAQWDSRAKVTGRTSVESKAPSSKISLFAASPLPFFFTCSETSPLTPRCFCYVLARLYSNVSRRASPLCYSPCPHSSFWLVTVRSSLLSPLFSSSWWMIALWVKEIKYSTPLKIPLQ